MNTYKTLIIPGGAVVENSNIKQLKRNLTPTHSVRYNVHMKKPKRKTITELRSTLFETFDEVVSGQIQFISHKNGSEIAMIPANKIEELYDEIELHKNLAIGYAQALRGEGITSDELKAKLKKKEKELRKKYD